VKMGSKSNIQDNCVVHTDGGFPCIIGDGVSIGHGVIIHGSIVDSNCLIGMGAILMNGSKLGMDCIVGAGSLVLQDVIIPERSLVVGSPASVKRKLTGAEIDKIRENAKHYCEFTMSYLREKYS